MTFGFVVGTDFHHYLFAFGFFGEGWVPGVGEDGCVERGGEVEAKETEEQEMCQRHGNIHIHFKLDGMKSFA